MRKVLRVFTSIILLLLIYMLTTSFFIQIPVIEAEETYDLAVMDFDVVSIDEEVEGIGGVLAQMLTTDLVQIPGLTVVERGRLEDALEEQEMQEAGLVREDQAVELGELVGADFIIAGTVLDLGDKPRFRMDYRIVDVEEGTVRSADSLMGEDRRELMGIMLRETAVGIGENLVPERVEEYAEEIEAEEAGEELAEKLTTIIEVVDAEGNYIDGAVVEVPELNKEKVTGEQGIVDLTYEEREDDLSFRIFHGQYEEFRGFFSPGTPSVQVEMSRIVEEEAVEEETEEELPEEPEKPEESAEPEQRIEEDIIAADDVGTVIGLDFPTLGWAREDDAGRVVGYRGINLLLGYSSKRYFSPLEEGLNTFWSWGTWYLIVPYGEIGADVVISPGSGGSFVTVGGAVGLPIVVRMGLSFHF